MSALFHYKEQRNTKKDIKGSRGVQTAGGAAAADFAAAAAAAADDDFVYLLKR